MQKQFQIFLLTFAILSMTFYACQEPEGIGLDVLPDGEQMQIAWIDTFTIEAETSRIDSFRTSRRSSFVIGDFGDPIFGRVRSELFTQFSFSSPPVFGDNPQIDSIILNLVYNGSYGRTDKFKGTHHFGVYEVIEDIDWNDTINYFSDDRAATSMELLTEVTFRPDLLNPIPVSPNINSDSVVPPSLRIRLPDEFGSRILSSGTENLASGPAFIEAFKGLNVRSLTPMMPSGFGSLLSFAMGDRNSAVEIYFSNADNDSLSFLFETDDDLAVYTALDHEFSQPVNDAIQQMQMGEDLLYVQSLAGTRIRVRFPFVRELNDLGFVAINKAELVLPVDENSLDDFPLPPLLTVSGISENDLTYVTNDLREAAGIDYFGGVYNSADQEYVFNVARYLQSVINSDEIDYGLFLSSANAVDGRRGVFNGPNHSDTTRQMKLRMTYSIIE